MAEDGAVIASVWVAVTPAFCRGWGGAVDMCIDGNGAKIEKFRTRYSLNEPEKYR